LPIHCYLCGAHPPSFALRPLPHACQICTSCPVPQDPDPHASPPPTSAGSGEVYAVVG
jgi:hypothetical protein